MGDKTVLQHPEKRFTYGLFSAGLICDGWIFLSGQGPLDMTCGQLVEGTIEEVRYAEAAGTEAVARDNLRHAAGAVAFLPGARAGIHSIHNPTEKPAVTLHIYGGDARKTGPNLSTVYTRAA